MISLFAARAQVPARRLASRDARPQCRMRPSGDPQIGSPGASSPATSPPPGAAQHAGSGPGRPGSAAGRGVRRRPSGAVPPSGCPPARWSSRRWPRFCGPARWRSRGSGRTSSVVRRRFARRRPATGRRGAGRFPDRPRSCRSDAATTCPVGMGLSCGPEPGDCDPGPRDASANGRTCPRHSVSRVTYTLTVHPTVQPTAPGDALSSDQAGRLDHAVRAVCSLDPVEGR